MQKKTIGSFIAVLRKANGMTQAQLAERLGVSNKTVSHWEQDDSAPDLSLIPVIAELFGVTCDELLKGERMTADTAVVRNSGRSERELENILNRTKSKFRMGTIISAALFVIALILEVFALSDSAFGGITITVVPAIISGVFAVMSAACQAVFLSWLIGSMHGSEIETEAMSNFKKQALLLSSFIISMNVGLLLMYVICYELASFAGVLVSVAVALILTAVLYNIILSRMIKSGEISESEQSAAVRKHNKNLALEYMCRLLIVLIVLAPMQIVINNNKDFIMRKLTEPITFNSFEELKDYMEKANAEGESMTTDGNPDNYGIVEAEETEEAEPDGEENYDDSYYNTDNLLGNHGEVLCEWKTQLENYNIVIGKEADGYLPVKLYLLDNRVKASTMVDRINIVFIVLYCAVPAVAGVVYLKKRKKSVDTVSHD